MFYCRLCKFIWFCGDDNKTDFSAFQKRLQLDEMEKGFSGFVTQADWKVEERHCLKRLSAWVKGLFVTYITLWTNHLIFEGWKVRFSLPHGDITQTVQFRNDVKQWLWQAQHHVYARFIRKQRHVSFKVNWHSATFRFTLIEKETTPSD